MKLPFNVEQFFAVFAAYNRAVWPSQVFLHVLALSAIALLRWRRQSASRYISAILSFFWVWMAILYHWAFFAAINRAAWVFGGLFLIQAGYFSVTGAIRGRLKFEAAGSRLNWMGGLLIGFALLAYPLLGLAAGERYPAFPTFGLPCPTTLFTLGVLLFLARPVPRIAFAVPLIWTGIGSLAALQLHVFQDISLLASGVGVLAALFSQTIRFRAVKARITRPENSSFIGRA